MKYRDGHAFRQAVEQKLKIRAGGNLVHLARDRKYVAFDRLLVRLNASAQDLWLLKGGFALDLRFSEQARTTVDVDIDWRLGKNELFDALVEAVQWDAGDFFSFSLERTRFSEDQLGGAHRFRVTAWLAGRRFESFQLDVGFREKKDWESEVIATSTLLSFTEIEPVQILALPLELHAAEKLHAYSRTYSHDRVNTRTKDLVDLVLLAKLSCINAKSLIRSISSVFSSRGTHNVPTVLPPPPQEWRIPFRELAGSVGLDPDLDSGFDAAGAFLDPVLSESINNGVWRPDERSWVVGVDQQLASGSRSTMSR